MNPPRPLSKNQKSVITESSNQESTNQGCHRVPPQPGGGRNGKALQDRKGGSFGSRSGHGGLYRRLGRGSKLEAGSYTDRDVAVL